MKTKLLFSNKYLLGILIALLIGSDLQGQNSLLRVGGNLSSDFNFYEYFDFSFGGTQKIDRVALGVSGGANIELHPIQRIGINVGLNYSFKTYKPDRTFSFGILKSVQLNTLEIPIRLRFNVTNEDKHYPEKPSANQDMKKRKLNYFVTAGITFQKELSVSTTYEDLDIPGFDFIEPRNYTLLNFGIGANYRIQPDLFLRTEFVFREGKCSCEYLNENVDKLALSFSIMKYL